MPHTVSVPSVCPMQAEELHHPETQVHTRLASRGGLHTPPHLNTEEAEAQKKRPVQKPENDVIS